jgi:uncharacterized membrane protein
MTQEIPATKNFSIAHGLGWLRAGLGVFGKAPMSWAALALVYLSVGFLFNLLPFVGRLVMVLLTPLFAASAFALAAEVDQVAPAEPRFASESLRSRALAIAGLLNRAIGRLFGIFNDLERALPFMIVGALALGGVVFIQILMQTLKVGTHTLGVLFGGAIPISALLPTLLGLITMVAIEIAFAMTLLYVVPLILFQHLTPLSALRASFLTSLANVLPLAVFAGVFLLGLGVLQWLFAAIGGYAYVAYFTLGTGLLPLLVAGLYCSHRDLHAP